MTPVISVEQLGKRYLLDHKSAGYATLRDAIHARSRQLLSKLCHPLYPQTRVASVEEFWALNDVSFEIRQGERVGIIGRNGAGKSTLLKILSRIIEPTTGRATIRGRVASLLEVGTGFHPELSGRENIFLNGAILGMSRAEIRKRFDEIVQFAEVEKFLDTPVKHYSSGMYVRLAFAVAAHLEPEIMIVDEVLAVGDAQFQKKCLGKMEEVAAQGRTVLFVSHNIAAVQKLCSKGIYLNKGRVEHVGTQAEAVSKYLSSGVENIKSLADRADRNGNQAVRVTSIEFVDFEGNSIIPSAGHELAIRLNFERRPDFDSRNIVAGIAVKTMFDVPVFLHHNRLNGIGFESLPERGYFELRIPRLPLPPSVYRINFSLIKEGQYVDAVSDAVDMTVVSGDYFQSGELPPASHGTCLVDGVWAIHPREAFLSGQGRSE